MKRGFEQIASEDIDQQQQEKKVADSKWSIKLFDSSTFRTVSAILQKIIVDPIFEIKMAPHGHIYQASANKSRTAIVISHIVCDAVEMTDPTETHLFRVNGSNLGIITKTVAHEDALEMEMCGDRLDVHAFKPTGGSDTKFDLATLTIDKEDTEDVIDLSSLKHTYHLCIHPAELKQITTAANSLGAKGITIKLSEPKHESNPVFKNIYISFSIEGDGGACTMVKTFHSKSQVRDIQGSDGPMEISISDRDGGSEGMSIPPEGQLNNIFEAVYDVDMLREFIVNLGDRPSDLVIRLEDKDTPMLIECVLERKEDGPMSFVKFVMTSKDDYEC